MTIQEFKKIYRYNASNDLLGEGTFGKVYAATEIATGRMVAIKQAPVKTKASKELNLLNEYELQKKLSHPNVAKYFSVERIMIEDIGYYDYGVMELYTGGNLQQFLSNNHTLSNAQKHRLIVKLLKGIDYLHQNNIIHRDIKPANILLDTQTVNGQTIYIPKIADFGLSKQLSDADNSRISPSFLGGTIWYSAPEQILGETLKLNADLWAMGVIIYEILLGKKLFEEEQRNIKNDDSQLQINSIILNTDLKQKLQNIPPRYKQMLTQCLVRNIDQRIQSADACLHLIEAHYEDDFVPQKAKATTDWDKTEVSDTPPNTKLENEELSIEELQAKYEVVGHHFSEGLAGVTLNGKCGFINKSGEVVIPLKYDFALSFFSEGLIGVQLNGKWGFVNTSGKEVIPLKYDFAVPFSEGLAGVELNGKCGFINTNDVEVIPFKYDKALSFSQGVGKVKLNDKYGFVNKSGQEVIPLIYTGVESFKNGKAKVELNGRQFSIDTNGNEIKQSKFKKFASIFAVIILLGSVSFYFNVFSFKLFVKEHFYYDDRYGFYEDLEIVRLNGKYGFIDKSGEEVIPLKYEDADNYFSEDLAAVKLNGKWGFINKNDEIVIPFKYYEDVESFSNGFAKVNLNDKWGFINKKGKEITPIKYDEVDNFIDGFGRIGQRGYNGYIDSKTYQEVETFTFGLVDSSGNEVVPCKYKYLGAFQDGMAKVYNDDKYGFIDKSGVEVVPLMYDDVGDFSEGLATVELNGKWGFVNRNGEEVIPLKYDYIYSFSEGLAGAGQNHKFGFINKSGEVVIPLKYDDVRDFHEGMAGIELNGQWGFINKNGEEVISQKYDEVTCFYNGKAIVNLNGRTFYIDKNGNEIK